MTQTSQPSTLRSAWPSPDQLDQIDDYLHLPVDTERLMRPEGVPYEMVCERLPAGEQGSARITHVTYRHADDPIANLRLMREGMPPVLDATYARLSVDGSVFMSDTPMERVTNAAFCKGAVGNVLVFGLGIGLILPPLQHSGRVTGITVVELNPDVIALVAPHYADLDKLKVVQGDAQTFKPKEKYDTVYFDIWPDISTKNLPQMQRLLRRARPWLEASSHPQRFAACWMHPYLQHLKDQEDA